MGPTAHSTELGELSTRRRGRIGAAFLALVLNGALVFLLASLGTPPAPLPGPTIEPIVAHLILEPLTLHIESTVPALTPRLIKPVLRLADKAPDFPIDAPQETPAPREHSDPQLSDGSPSSPRVT